MKQIIKPMAILVFLILICSVFARVLSGSESLAEYAAQNQTESEEQSSSAETANDVATGETVISTQEQAESDTGESSEESTESDTGESSEDNPVLSFYYEPLSDEVIEKITGISYIENENVALDDLRYLHILHYNFEKEAVEGELICNQAIAQDLLEIFYELYLAEYEIEKIRLIDEYEGDDTASMEDNNTSCFNYRVVDGTAKLSKHAYGLAIDINPFYNPYVVFQTDGNTYISPKGSEMYADRSTDFPYKIDENDLCYKLFTERGFIWGGSWNSSKDYQHFQKAVP